MKIECFYNIKKAVITISKELGDGRTGTYGQTSQVEGTNKTQVHHKDPQSLTFAMIKVLEKSAKVIYVARNPRDVVVSFFNHWRVMDGYKVNKITTKKIQSQYTSIRGMLYYFMDKWSSNDFYLFFHKNHIIFTHILGNL